MTPVPALIPNHDPDNGQHGDCLRACVASLLELKAEDVPHFYADGRTAEEARAYLDEWLEQRGLWECIVPYTITLEDAPPDDVIAAIGQQLEGRHWMLTACSRRGVDHVVICRGGQVVHDPTYGAEHGIVGPATDGHYWLSVLAIL